MTRRKKRARYNTWTTTKVTLVSTSFCGMIYATRLEIGGSLCSRLEAKDLLPNASSPEVFRDAPQAERSSNMRFRFVMICLRLRMDIWNFYSRS